MENDVYSQTLRPQELGLHLFRGPRLRVRRYFYIVREPCPITMYTNDLNSLLDRTTSYKWLSDRVPLEVTPAVPNASMPFLMTTPLLKATLLVTYAVCTWKGMSPPQPPPSEKEQKRLNGGGDAIMRTIRILYLIKVSGNRASGKMFSP